MLQISQRINSLAASATLAMSQRSNELRAQGVDVINLSVGEPDFNTPEFIKDAAKLAIDRNFTFYSPVPGYLSLRQAASATYFVDFDQKEGYQGMNIVSIITDPDNLFDYDTGIYVMGRAYDTSREYDAEQ